MKQFLLCLLVVMSAWVYGQKRPLGTWRSHFPYNSSLMVCDAGNFVYSAAPRSVFSYNKSDGAVTILDKVNGLSDVQLSKMCFNEEENTLVIAYENSNIDLVKNQTDIYNLPDLKNKITASSKIVNAVSAYGQYAYVACDLGVLEVDLHAREVKNNYIVGNGGANTRVADVAVNDNYIFAVTQDGFKQAQKNGANLLDYANWQTQDGTNGLPVNIDSMQGMVTAFSTGFILSSYDTLYLFQNGQWTVFNHELYWKTRSMRVENDRLYVCQRRDSLGTISDVRLLEVDANFTTQFYYPESSARPNAGFRDTNNWWYIADEWNGLIRQSNSGSEFLVPDGPHFSSCNKVDASGENWYAASSSFQSNFAPTYNYNGFSKFSNGSWQTLSASNILPSDPNKVIDANCVLHSASKNKTYVGTIGGLVEYDDQWGLISIYDSQNSSLGTAVGDPSRCKISAMCFDATGNLWMANMQAAKRIAVFTHDGQWFSFSVPNCDIILNMAFDESGNLWCAGTAGMLVYNPGSDLSITTDDSYRLLSTAAGNGALPHSISNCVVTDKSGDVWVGTNEGIATFYCSGSVLTSSGCDADKIKVVRDGFVDYLFKSEKVRALKVDGGNRKWVGTENGVWLISEDGKEELLHFDAESSPLPSNVINDIGISTSGEVFISTALGLVSYMGNATYGDATPSNVLVFPNPVEHNYTGDIAIRGLVDDAYVKITDTRGTLVYQGTAFGGQMIWNGNGYDGQRAASGVYMVFSSDDMGKNRCVTKITLLN